MRLTGVCPAVILLLAGLVAGCGRDSKPTPPSEPSAPPNAEANAPVSAELDKYMRDGNVFVKDEPIESFSAVADLKSGTGRRRETRLENWTATSTVSFVRDTPEGKLFKVVYEVRSPTNKFGPPGGTSHYLLAHDGLYSANASGAKVGAVPSIPAELAVGKEWSGSAEGGQRRFYKIEAKETVEVPAGKFEAYKIVSGVGQTPTYRVWYAPGVGIVQEGQDRSRPGLKEIRIKK